MDKGYTAMSKLIAMVTMVALLFGLLEPTRAYGQDRPAPAAARSTPDSAAASTEESEEPAAPEYIVTLQEGESAPFDGTFFNVPAAARLLTDLRSRSEACEIETTRRLRLLEADLRLQIETEAAHREALQYRHDQLMEIRDGQIDFLTEHIQDPDWYETGEFWFAMGTVSGIAVTVLSAYILSLIGS